MLMFLRQWRHMATNDSTNCTSRTMKPRLHNAQETLRRSQLHNEDIWLQTILQIAPHVLWNQGYTMHKKPYDVLNYTMHTKMLMLEEWRQTKGSVVTPNYFDISYFKTLNPFHFYPFHFLVSHSCNWLVGLLLWWLNDFGFWFELADNGSRSWVGVQCTQFSL